MKRSYLWLTLMLLAFAFSCGSRPALPGDGSGPSDGHKYDGPLQPDLFVFRDGKGRETLKPTIYVVPSVAAVSDNIPGSKYYPNTPSPLDCSVTLSISNGGPGHASGIHLEKITVERLDGGHESISTGVKSTPYFNGVVLAGQNVTQQFQCLPVSWSPPLPFNCGDYVTLRSSLIYADGNPIAFATRPVAVQCPL